MGTLQTKKAAVTSPGASLMIPHSISGRPIERPWQRQDLMAVAATACETAANAEVFRADAVAKAPFGVIEGDEFDPDHDLSRLFAKPNLQYSQSDFWHQVMYTLLSDINGCYVVAPLNNVGRPMELWVRTSKQVRPVPDSTTFISGYQMRVDQSWVPVDPDQYLIWQHRYVPMDPDDLFGSWPPLHRAASSVRSIAYLGQWIEALLKDRAILDGFITTKTPGQYDTTKLDAIEARMLSKLEGPGNAGGYRFLPGDLQLIELSGKLADIDPGATQDRLETSICSSFQLNPISVRTHAGMSVSGGLGGDKISALITQDYQGTVTSDWNLLTADVGIALAECYGLTADDVGFNTSGIKELDESIDAKYTRLKGAWFLSPNEALQELGKDPNPNPMSDLPLAVIQATRGMGTSPTLPPEDTSKRTGMRPFIFSKANNPRGPIATAAQAHEAAMAAAALALFADEHTDMQATMDDWGDEIPEDATPALQDNVAPAKWVDAMGPLISAAMLAGAGAATIANQVPTDWQVQVASDYSTRTDKITGDITKTTFDLIQQAVDNARIAGEDRYALADRIAGVYDMSDARALTIATTESVGSANAGAAAMADAAVEAGYEVIGTWHHAGSDEKEPREDHLAADGEESTWGEPFSTGLLYPHDPDGDAADVINCQCEVDWVATQDPDGNDLELPDTADEE